MTLQCFPKDTNHIGISHPKVVTGREQCIFWEEAITVHINKQRVYTSGLNSNYESNVFHFCLVWCLWESMAGGPEFLAWHRAQISSTSQVISEAGMSACQPDKLSNRKFLMEELSEFILNLLFLIIYYCLCLSIRSCSLDVHGRKFWSHGQGWAFLSSG